MVLFALFILEKTNKQVAVNSSQVVIGLQDQSIIYFELDAVGQLQERAKPEMGGGVVRVRERVRERVKVREKVRR